jgi:hypothetical protein
MERGFLSVAVEMLGATAGDVALPCSPPATTRLVSATAARLKAPTNRTQAATSTATVWSVRRRRCRSSADA